MPFELLKERPSLPLSNWYSSPYVHEGQRFCGAEQGMMYEKARLFDPTGREIALIMATTDPKTIKDLGRSVKKL